MTNQRGPIVAAQENLDRLKCRLAREIDMFRRNRLHDEITAMESHIARLKEREQKSDN